MADSPKAFISHASEDKKEFAEPLARLLREQGIDAWLDTWEIKFGDTLVAKIFEEGLADAGTCIYLMSKNSVNKPWVRAEFENAITQRINGQIRLIPVRLEECDAPNSVNSILWVDLEREGSIEVVADKIAKVLHGHSEKPPLGKKPTWTDAPTIGIYDLDQIDEVVLGLVYEVALHGNRKFVQGAELLLLAEAIDIDWDHLKETCDYLCEEGFLVDHDHTIAGRNIIVEMPLSQFLDIAVSRGLDLQRCQREVGACILNESLHSVRDITEWLKEYPASIVSSVVQQFENQGFINVLRAIGGGERIQSPSVGFKRWLQKNS